MILSEEEYRAVLGYCRGLIDTGATPSLCECMALGIDLDTVASVCSQLNVRKVKKMSHVIESQIESIYQRYESGESLIAIAKEKKFSPYKLAKIFAKYFLPSNFQLSKLFCPGGGEAISDPRMLGEMMRCCLEDPYSSHSCDAVKHCIGREFEELLYDSMRSRQMCFETESDLRLQGKPKTPDVLFLFPMGVRVPVKGEVRGEWQIVHWIDSKAMFGDPDTYSEHLEQLHGYANRLSQLTMKMLKCT
mmetsp:Transcript_16268/g.24513  ORF Transcript_16268/g.24513 Transcript_16268/m.24513 type:complete len:247 (-) Transcript_16268:389-1129(-)